jgi:diaminopimelate epimerase
VLPEVRCYSAAGNRFAVLAALEREPRDPAGLARGLCERHATDGLLLGAAPRAGGDLRMVVYNRDGSRAEACGNGLRALARWAFETEHASEEMVIETDGGARRVACILRAGHAVAARAELGVPFVLERSSRLEAGGKSFRVSLLDLGNPHCVLFVPDVSSAEVERIGPLLERHARFPRGTNVSFVEGAGAGGGLRVRTWERGVGETASCGTGAAASALAARLDGRATLPLEVHTRGGRIVVEEGEGGVLFLTGPVETLGA